MSAAQSVERVLTKRQTLWGSEKLFVLPPNFLAIPMGLAGLSGSWLLASTFFRAPMWIALTLYIVTTLVYLLLCTIFIGRFWYTPRTVLTEMTHPILGPFYSLLPIVGMQLTFCLLLFDRQVALILFLCFCALTILYGGWITGQWIVGTIKIDDIHPGYFFPTVAGSFIAADGATRFGFLPLGALCFGIGTLCWLVLGSIILNRLFTRPPLSPTLFPTLAIEIAPPALAGSAYFALMAGRIEMMTYVIGGYVLIMTLIQLRLLPLYVKLPFSPGFWSFTFPYTALVSYLLRCLHFGRFTGSWPFALCWILLAALTMLIGAIAWRSCTALRANSFLPAPTRA